MQRICSNVRNICLLSGKSTSKYLDNPNAYFQNPTCSSSESKQPSDLSSCERRESSRFRGPLVEQPRKWHRHWAIYANRDGSNHPSNSRRSLLRAASGYQSASRSESAQHASVSQLSSKREQQSSLRLLPPSVVIT